MENASKALVMAGGILIAIMTISALLYAANSWGVIPKAQDTTDTVKQLTAFNQQYESYAKQAIYGLDLVSVLNKAIDNNEKYGVSNEEERMYVNIIFTLKNSANKVKYSYKDYISGPKKGQKSERDTEYDIDVLEAGEYSLKNLGNRKFKEFIQSFKNSTFIKQPKLRGPEEDGSKYNLYTNETYATSEFKTRVFRCIGTKYDDEGRIKLMEFEEISQEDLDEQFK